ncbi:hypothetical protein [Dethiosulfatarculus sandiegensis]|uniref:Uncharacterized protein n=1 Tax=Dethiosulfatarculus sandiegensis TaxID=1429043 RepID=A0A0D2JDX6_9BACT|nr:hypothetical protein [Dethiosulfatarculus sandiegensis]KIX13866.1 hypothetical protein X474_11470 [Dethiosulfatarculus sandiegensis]
MQERQIAWIHLPDKSPEALTNSERSYLETALWLSRTNHPMGKRFARVFHHAVSACLDLLIWERGRSKRDYLSLPPFDPSPISPLMRERLEGILWILRQKKGSSLASHLEAMLLENLRMAAQVDPARADQKTDGKVVDFDRAVQKRNKDKD